MVSALTVANVVTDFGADPTGVADSTAKFQSAFSGAWGTQSNTSLNRILWIPAGTYKITSPLYMQNKLGVTMLGAGMQSSILSFNPSTFGNSLSSDGLTPCIMQNGVGYSLFTNFGIVGPSTTPNITICGIDMWNDGTQGYTGTCKFQNLAISNVALGIIVNDPPGANCENGVVDNCYFDTCTTAALRIVGFNTLNWAVFGGRMSNCAANTTYSPITPVADGNHYAAISVDSGGVINVSAVSFVNNAADIVNFGSQGMIVDGGTSTSQFFYYSVQGAVNAFHFRPAHSLNCVFVNGFSTSYNTVSGCIFDPQANNGVGYIARTGGNSQFIFDGLTLGANAGACIFDGSSSAKIYNRACNFVPVGGTLNPNLFTSFTGTRAQNI